MNDNSNAGSVRIVPNGSPASDREGHWPEFEINTDQVPAPARYRMILPDGYETSSKSYPLFLLLHGGGGINGFEMTTVGLIQKQMETGVMPEMIVVTPDCKRSLYMDYRDGSQKWERFIIDELLPHLHSTYRTANAPEKTFIGGISMGGMGALRMGFKYPDMFGAILAFEPAIEPSIDWKDVRPEDKFYRTPDVFEEKFGSPVDEVYWRANNPSAIICDRTKEIRNSCIKIYIEVGTKDVLGLFRGAEFIHRLLFDQNIPHEYRLVYGADHVGLSLPSRMVNGFEFLKRVLDPPSHDPVLQGFRDLISGIKKNPGSKNG